MRLLDLKKNLYKRVNYNKGKRLRIQDIPEFNIVCDLDPTEVEFNGSEIILWNFGSAMETIPLFIENRENYYLTPESENDLLCILKLYYKENRE